MNGNLSGAMGKKKYRAGCYPKRGISKADGKKNQPIDKALAIVSCDGLHGLL